MEHFRPRGKVGEQDKHRPKVESEIMKLYPNGEVMTVIRIQPSKGSVEREIGETIKS